MQRLTRIRREIRRLVYLKRDSASHIRVSTGEIAPTPAAPFTEDGKDRGAYKQGSDQEDGSSYPE